MFSLQWTNRYFNCLIYSFNSRLLFCGMRRMSQSLINKGRFVVQNRSIEQRKRTDFRCIYPQNRIKSLFRCRIIQLRVITRYIWRICFTLYELPNHLLNRLNAFLHISLTTNNKNTLFRMIQSLGISSKKELRTKHFTQHSAFHSAFHSACHSALIVALALPEGSFCPTVSQISLNGGISVRMTNTLQLKALLQFNNCYWILTMNMQIINIVTNVFQFEPASIIHTSESAWAETVTNLSHKASLSFIMPQAIQSFLNQQHISFKSRTKLRTSNNEQLLMSKCS